MHPPKQQATLFYIGTGVRDACGGVLGVLEGGERVVCCVDDEGRDTDLFERELLDGGGGEVEVEEDDDVRTPWSTNYRLC